MNLEIENLAPDHFSFWQPPPGSVIHAGAERTAVPLPEIPLPINREQMEDPPGDNAVGAGLYDYLRRFPDCRLNGEYAGLLREGYSHFLADLAAQVVMLDSKDVEPAYVLRKLNYLKILCLLEPGNPGLLRQLAEGFYDLAMTFTELPQVRRHLLDAMRFGHELLKCDAEDSAALNLLAETDILFGDYPAAIGKLRRLSAIVTDPTGAAAIQDRLDHCLAVGFPDHPLVDDLERVGEAMQLYADGNSTGALELLDGLEADNYFLSELRSADFFCLLGMCRISLGDPAGALGALGQALEIDPDHVQARDLVDSL